MIITKKTIEKLKEKDEDTFEKIYFEYEKLVFYICYQITKNKHASEDLTQETFLKLITSLDNYNECGKFKEYIMMIARNLSKNYITRIEKNSPLLDDEQINHHKDQSNLHKVIYFINDYLDELSAEIVTLKIVHNFKFKEIAEYKGLTIGVVQSTYYQAIKTLRKEINYE